MKNNKGMLLRFILFIVMSVHSVNSISSPGVKKTATELITQQEWVFAGAGYDENRNGLLDNEETIITECEKDNTCLFLKNGMGIYYDNRIVCGTGVTEHLFKWKFANKEKALVLDEDAVQLSCLNEDNLVFFDNTKGHDGKDMRYITVFIHAPFITN